MAGNAECLLNNLRRRVAQSGVIFVGRTIIRTDGGRSRNQGVKHLNKFEEVRYHSAEWLSYSGANVVKVKALTALLLIVTMAPQAGAWVYLQEDKMIEKKAFPIRMQKGEQVEDGVIIYRFIVNLTMNQLGSAWKGSKMKDDRRCAWSVTPRVERDICFSTILGSSSCENELRATMDFGLSGESVINNFLDHDTCGDDLKKAKGHRDKVEAEMISQKEDFFQDDLKTVTERLKGFEVTVDYSAEITPDD